MNPPARVKLGIVGVPLPTMEVVIADDGELLLPGGTPAWGIATDPAKAAEMLDADGWVDSGDLANIDADGYLKIVGRKKE